LITIPAESKGNPPTKIQNFQSWEGFVSGRSAGTSTTMAASASKRKASTPPGIAPEALREEVPGSEDTATGGVERGAGRGLTAGDAVPGAEEDGLTEIVPAAAGEDRRGVPDEFWG
jgi:hypothetical protein